jgi:hypothetical protein
MEEPNMSRCLFASLGMLLLATFSAAQSTDHVEVFGGYSYLNSDFTSSVSGGVSGWNVSGTVKIVRYAGIVLTFPASRRAGGIRALVAAAVHSLTITRTWVDLMFR